MGVPRHLKDRRRFAGVPAAGRGLAASHPGRLFIFPFPGSIRLAGQAAMAIRRGARLGCHRGPAAGAAGGGDIGDLQPLENPVGKCSLRDVLAKGAPLRSGECWPAIRRSRKRWHWDKPGRDRGGAWQDAGMPFGKRKGRFPQREPAFQILVGPPGLEPGTCRL